MQDRYPRVLWDFLKYKIRHETIIYSKKRAKERRSLLVNLEERLKDCQVKGDDDPTIACEQGPSESGNKNSASEA